MIHWECDWNVINHSWFSLGWKLDKLNVQSFKELKAICCWKLVNEFELIAVRIQSQPCLVRRLPWIPLLRLSGWVDLLSTSLILHFCKYKTNFNGNKIEFRWHVLSLFLKFRGLSFIDPMTKSYLSLHLDWFFRSALVKAYLHSGNILYDDGVAK